MRLARLWAALLAVKEQEVSLSCADRSSELQICGAFVWLLDESTSCLIEAEVLFAQAESQQYNVKVFGRSWASMTCSGSKYFC